MLFIHFVLSYDFNVTYSE